MTYSLHISKREQELPNEVIGKLQEIASEHPNVISLGPGEPDFKTPKEILNAGAKILLDSKKYDVGKYTPVAGMTELRDAIAQKLRSKNKIINATAEEVIVTCGSQQGIFAGLISALDKGEQCIIPNPGYLGYLPAIKLVDAKPISLMLNEENNYDIDVKKLKNIIARKKVKLLILNTPNNPTGKVLSKKILEEIADIAREYNLLIFSDEAYEDLIYDAKHISIESLNGMQNHAVTFHTFSKTYAMCGFRLGYAHGPKKIIEAMIKTSQYMTLAPPHISQLIGLHTLQSKKITKEIEQMRAEYNKRRKYIVQQLNTIGLKTPMPQGAFYAFANIKNTGMKSNTFAEKLLQEQKVAVVPGTEFGTNGEGYIRLSYATKMPLIQIAMERIEKFLNEHKRRK